MLNVLAAIAMNFFMFFLQFFNLIRFCTALQIGLDAIATVVFFFQVEFLWKLTVAVIK